ncbi:MAG: hypothetical protein ACPG4N_07825 [Gammaproteobacteria bacterium]
MLTKILFTLAILGAAFAWLKARSNSGGSNGAKPGAGPAKSPANEADKQPQPPKLLAAIVLSVFVVLSGLYFYLDWQRANEQVTVRVINTRNGDTAEYLARQRDVNGRKFKTVDGRTITLADTERMEVSEPHE